MASSAWFVSVEDSTASDEGEVAMGAKASAQLSVT
jgi:hypothetical protein